MYNKLLRTPIGLLPSIVLILILIATLMPSSDLPDGPEIPNIDKAVHFILFGLLSALFLVDWGRILRGITPSMIVVSAIFATILGALIELAQQIMELGRSADLIDLVADALGAILIPVTLLPLIRRIIRDYDLRLLPAAHPSSRQLSRIRDLYTQSFPASERRPWPKQKALLEAPSAPLNLEIIYTGGRFAGFITWWTLDCGLRYIEHFAILPSLRGKSIGSNALSVFLSRSAMPVVLEVEPAGSSDMADRRIAFYSRLGLIPHHNHPYIQPPYDNALPSMPLTLMTTPLTSKAPSLPTIAATIHRQVYTLPALRSGATAPTHS